MAQVQQFLMGHFRTLCYTSGDCSNVACYVSCSYIYLVYISAGKLAAGEWAC